MIFSYVLQILLKEKVLQWAEPKIRRTVRKFLSKKIVREHCTAQQAYSDMDFNKVTDCDRSICANDALKYHHLCDETNFTESKFRKAHGVNTLAQILLKLPKNIEPKSEREQGQSPNDFLQDICSHCVHQLKKVDAHKHSFYVDGLDIQMWPEDDDTPEELKIKEATQKYLNKSGEKFLSLVGHVATPNSAFSSHCEIFFVGALNFHCAGAPKFWIIIPDIGDNIAKFENFLKEKYHHSCDKIFVHRTALLTLEQLREAKVEFSWTLQQPGEYLLVCHKAIHMGFNLGINVNAVRFWVGEEWLKYAFQYNRCFKHQAKEDPDMKYRTKSVKHYKKKIQARQGS